jgi:hypothetical protein
MRGKGVELDGIAVAAVGLVSAGDLEVLVEVSVHVGGRLVNVGIRGVVVSPVVDWHPAPARIRLDTRISFKRFFMLHPTIVLPDLFIRLPGC